MKFYLLSFLLVLLFSCKNKTNNSGFNIQGEIAGNYKGKIYLYYDGKNQDSSIVSNNFFQFSGSLQKPKEASIFSDRLSSSDRNFFIENGDIKLKVSYTKKKIKGYEMDWFDIGSVSGTKTSKIESEIQEMLNNKDSNQEDVLFERVDNVIEQYKDHPIAGSILHELSNDTIFSKENLKKLYEKMDLKNQNAYDLKIIEYNFTEHSGFKKGDAIYDFILPDLSNKMIDTKEFRRDSYVLFDFWAFWCIPCRKEFPELKKTYNLHKKKNFKILGVSLDENMEKWKTAVTQEELPWMNVVDTTAFDGNIARKYMIRAIPYNVLVDPRGIIIGVKLDTKTLNHKMDSIFNKSNE